MASRRRRRAYPRRHAFLDTASPVGQRRITRSALPPPRVRMNGNVSWAKSPAPDDALVIAPRRGSGRFSSELDSAFDIGEKLQMLFNHATGQLGHINEITVAMCGIEISLLDPQQFEMSGCLGGQILAIEFRAGRGGTHFFQSFAAAPVKMLFDFGLTRRLDGSVSYAEALHCSQDIRQRLLFGHFQLCKLFEIVGLRLLLRNPTNRQRQGAYRGDLPHVLFVRARLAARRWTWLGLRER